MPIATIPFIEISEKQKRKFFLKTESGYYQDCWNWQGRSDKDGYGIICIKRIPRRASRVSYMIHFGKIPESMLVLHTCDNTKCVNPSHLFVGTHRANMNDKVIKSRCNMQSGENHWTKRNPQLIKRDKARYRTKLTTGMVIEIRELMASGARTVDVSSKYGISCVHARKIASGEKWSKIPLAISANSAKSETDGKQ